MNCFVHLLALCVFDPSNVFVRGELNFALDDSHQTIGQWGEGEWCRTRWCSGPVGKLAVGVTMPISRTIELDYGVQHQSRTNTTKDNGYESAFISMTWRPFR